MSEAEQAGLSWSNIAGAVTELAAREGIDTQEVHDELARRMSDPSDMDEWVSEIAALSLGLQAGTLALAGGGSGYDAVALAAGLSMDERKKLVAKGQALSDGSYPVPDVSHLKAAAVLCRSRHGDWQAAARLIARRARELQVPNPLSDSDGKVAASSLISLSAGDPAAYNPAAYGDTAALEVGDLVARHPGMFDMGKVARASAEPLAPPPQPSVASRYDDGYDVDLDTMLSGPVADQEILRLTASPAALRRGYFAGAAGDGGYDSDDEDQDDDGDPTDYEMPARGGQPHAAEVDRLAAKANSMIKGDNGNRTHRPLSPAERERARRRSRSGHT